MFFYAASAGVKALNGQITLVEKVLTVSGYLAASPVVPLVIRFTPGGQFYIIILLLLNSLFWTLLFSFAVFFIKKIRKS